MSTGMESYTRTAIENALAEEQKLTLNPVARHFRERLTGRLPFRSRPAKEV
jgi:hypothetical protein